MAASTRPMHPIRKYAALFALTPLVLALDQWTKFLAVSHLTHALSGAGAPGFFSANHLLALRTEPYTLTSFWKFVYAENPGAAFSFLAGASSGARVPFFYVVAVVATVLIGYFYAKSGDGQGLRRVALALVLGGAFGNTLDRIFHGYVIDFILWHAGSHEWPVFNVADSFVCVGVFLLLTENWWVKMPAASPVTEKPATP